MLALEWSCLFGDRNALVLTFESRMHWHRTKAFHRPTGANSVALVTRVSSDWPAPEFLTQRMPSFWTMVHVSFPLSPFFFSFSPFSFFGRWSKIRLKNRQKKTFVVNGIINSSSVFNKRHGSSFRGMLAIEWICPLVDRNALLVLTVWIKNDQTNWPASGPWHHAMRRMFSFCFLAGAEKHFKELLDYRNFSLLLNKATAIWRRFFFFYATKRPESMVQPPLFSPFRPAGLVFPTATWRQLVLYGKRTTAMILLDHSITMIFFFQVSGFSSQVK